MLRPAHVSSHDCPGLLGAGTQTVSADLHWANCFSRNNVYKSPIQGRGKKAGLGPTPY